MESIDYFIKEGSFKDKNIIVTGGTGGIGAPLAEALIKCGARVCIIAKNEKKVIEKFDKYRKTQTFDYELINFENPPAITSSFANIMKKFKGRLDILLMCHGVFKVGKLMET